MNDSIDGRHCAGESSVKLSVRTDVSTPLSSSVTNVTCHEDNSVSVMWTPCTWSDDHVLHSSARCVYTLQMLDTGSGELTSVTINTTHSSGDNDVMVTRTQPLTPDTTYIVSVLAASVSLYRSGVTYPAPSSAEVHLHLHGQCHLSYSPHHDGSAIDDWLRSRKCFKAISKLQGGNKMSNYLRALYTAGE